MSVTQGLPQLDRPFLTDGGLETDLIFNHGFDIPLFASITLLQSEEGRALLDHYCRGYLEIAKAAGKGFVLESVTWRASPDWAAPLGLTTDALDALNLAAIAAAKALRDDYQTSDRPVIVSACIGPCGDGYDPGTIMTVEEAQAYHRHQAAVLASAGPDMFSAATITNVNEAIGIARAVAETGLPMMISFTVETDGRLPTGDRLGEAIEAVDRATDSYPAYFMINCAHPSHFEAELRGGGAWTRRVRAIRANASRCSHAELDRMTTLDAGDPEELAAQYRALLADLPWITVLGGCCGTDHRHVAAIARACFQPA